MLHGKLGNLWSSGQDIKVTNEIIVAEVKDKKCLSTVEQCGGMGDVWRKYHLKLGPALDRDGEIGEEDIADVVYASGLSRKILLKTPLVSLMDARPFDLKSFTDKLNVLKDNIVHEHVESIKITCLAYKVRDANGESFHNSRTISGRKKCSPSCTTQWRLAIWKLLEL